MFSKHMNNFTKYPSKQNTINEIPRYLIDVIFVLIIFMIIFVNMEENNDWEKIVPIEDINNEINYLEYTWYCKIKWIFTNNSWFKALFGFII